MSISIINKKILEVGCTLLVPCQSKKIICINTKENTCIILLIPDIRTINEFFTLWLEMNDI